jgi:DNA-3-methyladenine glycosylase
VTAAGPLPRAFYARDPRVVGPELLGKVLVRAADPDRGLPPRAGRIVEVEAYCGGEDPGSHAYRGRTPRNATMFGPAGGLYVYFTYGMHWCANAVCGEEGEGVAVLLRALAPLEGLDAMRVARPAARRDRDLCSGPAKLCQALGVDGNYDGCDLVTGDRGVTVVDDGTPPPADPVVTTRIGLSAGAEHPWRYLVANDPNVSVRPGADRRPRAGRRTRAPARPAGARPAGPA